MKGYDFIVGKYGAVFSDGVILTPGTIVQYNGSQMGYGDRESQYVSFKILNKQNKIEVVSSNYPEEFYYMKDKDILVPADDYLKPKVESNYNVGDIVLFSNKLAIVTNKEYDFINNKWLYVVEKIEIYKENDNSVEIRITNVDHLCGGFVDDIDLSYPEIDDSLSYIMGEYKIHLQEIERECVK